MTDFFRKREMLLSKLTRTLAAPAALALVLAACEPPAEEPEEPEIENAEDVEEAVDETGDAAEEVADEVEDTADEIGEEAEETEEETGEEPEGATSEEDAQ